MGSGALGNLRDNNGASRERALILALIITILVVVAAPIFRKNPNQGYDTKATQVLNIGYKAAKIEAANTRNTLFPPKEALAAAVAYSNPELGSVSTAEPDVAVSAISEGRLVILDPSSLSGNFKEAYKSKSGLAFSLTVTNNGAPVIATCGQRC